MKDSDLMWLIDAGSKFAQRYGDGRYGCEFIGDLPNVQFDNIPKTHDWRNHVDEPIRAAWPEMGIDGMVAVYLITARLAEAEEWE